MKIKNDKLFIQITCLIASIALWVVVMINTNPLYDDTITNIPITIRNLSALENSNLVLMNSDKDNLTVNVKVKGYADQLNKISKTDFSAYIDVLGFTEGISNAKVEIIGPSGIQIESYYPSQIPCIVEGIISKIMDVSVQYEGTQAKNYYRGSGTPNPSSVKITGPRSVVNSAKEAIATVNVDNAQESIAKTVPVRIYDDTNKEIFMSVPTGNVEVTVPIYPTKYVNIIPKIIGSPLEGYTLVDVKANPDRVKIAAPQDILNNIQSLELNEIDITNSYENILAAKEIINDNGVLITDFRENPVVSIIIEKIDKKEFEFKYEDIVLENIKEGYSVKPPEGKEIITVTVEGATSILSKVKKDDIKLFIDLSQIDKGVNSFNIETKTDIKLTNIVLSNNNIELEVVESTDSNNEQT